MSTLALRCMKAYRLCMIGLNYKYVSNVNITTQHADVVGALRNFGSSLLTRRLRAAPSHRYTK